MSDKEQISTLISVGTGLPPINPDLADEFVTVEKTAQDKNKRRNKNKEATPGKQPASSPNDVAPDPKEYIAELERPEEDILY